MMILEKMDSMSCRIVGSRSELFLSFCLQSPDQFPPFRYVLQVVVPKALAPKELVQVYESGEMVVLPPWDPMVRFP